MVPWFLPSILGGLKSSYFWKHPCFEAWNDMFPTRLSTNLPFHLPFHLVWTKGKELSIQLQELVAESDWQGVVVGSTNLIRFSVSAVCSNEKRGPRWLVGLYRGLYQTTQLYRDYFINHEIRIPINQPGWLMESRAGFFFVAHFPLNRNQDVCIILQLLSQKWHENKPTYQKWHETRRWRRCSSSCPCCSAECLVCCTEGVRVGWTGHFFPKRKKEKTNHVA